MENTEYPHMSMAEFYDWFMSLDDDLKLRVQEMAEQAVGFAVITKHDAPVSVLLSAVAVAMKRQIADQQEWERLTGRTDYPSE